MPWCLFWGQAVFGIIFWRVCGRVSLVPFNIVVLGLVAVILIFAYFAVFTAIASATPGLLWMGCEIRNLQGDHPTLQRILLARLRSSGFAFGAHAGFHLGLRG